MKVYTWNDIVENLNTGAEPLIAKGTGISTGSFDGLHKGHRFLVQTLKHKCDEYNLLCGVVTFSRPLPSYKHASDYQGDISTLNQKLYILEQLGVDFVIVVDFEDSFACMLGSDYLNILVNTCNMELIAEGVDFRCGYKGNTDVQAIKYYAEQHSLKTVFVDPVYYRPGTDEEERVSSSYIRQMIKKGFFSTVTELLERPYGLSIQDAEKKFINGTDSSVRQILDIQKVNLKQVFPKNGVYRVHSENGKELRLTMEEDSFKVEGENLSDIKTILF